MDAAARSVQLVYCGVDRRKTVRRSVSATSGGAWYRRSFVRIPKRNGVVRAIATEPKPTDTESPAKSDTTSNKVVNGNGSFSTSSSKSVNGVSTVGLLNS